MSFFLPGMFICPNCGEIVDPIYETDCPNCGEQFLEDDDLEMEEILEDEMMEESIKEEMEEEWDSYINDDYEK